MISKRAPASRKGAALGIYSSSQFLGGAAGSNLGEFALGHWGIGGAFLAAGVLALVWLGFGTGVEPHATQPEEDTHELSKSFTGK
jgi:MFS family permease